MILVGDPCNWLVLFGCPLSCWCSVGNERGNEPFWDSRIKETKSDGWFLLGVMPHFSFPASLTLTLASFHHRLFSGNYWCPFSENRVVGVPSALLGPPIVPFDPFLEEGSPTKIDDKKKLVPTYSNLSTGGPSLSRGRPKIT